MQISDFLLKKSYFQFSAYRLSLDSLKYNYFSWHLICSDVPKKVKWLGRCMLNIFLKWSTYGAHALTAGGLSLLPNFQKKGTDRISIFRGRLMEKRGDFFEQGGGRDRSFNITNKLKSDILNDKKNLQTKMFICHN